MQLPPNSDLTSSARHRFRSRVSRAISTQLLVAVCCVAGLVALGRENLSVTRVLPQGNDVPTSLGEISISFNRPAIRFGEEPTHDWSLSIETKPHLDCAWTWTNTDTLTCYLNEDLQRATQYSIIVHPNFATYDGLKLSDSHRADFVTELPKLSSSTVYWVAPSEVSVSIGFSQPVTYASLKERIQLKDLSTGNVVGVDSDRIHPTGISTMYLYNDSGKWERLRKLERGLGAKIDYDDSRVANRYFWVRNIRGLEVGTTYVLEVVDGLRSIFGDETSDGSFPTQEFYAFPKFELVGIECFGKSGEVLTTMQGKPASEPRNLSGCDPNQHVEFLFTAPIDHDNEEFEIPISPQPRIQSDHAMRMSFNYSTGRDANRVSIAKHDDDPYFRTTLGLEFDGSTVYEVGRKLQVQSQSPGVVRKKHVRDSFGRLLSVPSILKFETSYLDPEIAISSSSMITPGWEGENLSVKTTNVAEVGVKASIRQGPTDGELKIHEVGLPVNAERDKQHVTDLDVREWLNHQSGQVLGQLTPKPFPLTGDSPGNRCFFTQFTPYQVVFKRGNFSSLVWVTDLKTGNGVPGAKVAYVQTTGLHMHALVETNTDTDGVALIPGSNELWSMRQENSESGKARNSGAAEIPHQQRDCFVDLQSTPAIFVEGKDGTALLPLANLSSKGVGQPLNPFMFLRSRFQVWGHTAQGIYRPGETVDYKLYVREYSADGLSIPGEFRFRLEVRDSLNRTVFERDNITLNNFGTFNGEFEIPAHSRDTRLTFSVGLQPDESSEAAHKDRRYGWDSLEAMDVRVVEFVAESFKVETELSADDYRYGDQLKVTSTASLHAGGPFISAPYSISARLTSTPFRSQIRDSKSYSYWNDHKRVKWDKDSLELSGPTTDDAGKVVASTKLESTDIFWGTIFTEVSIQDDRGKKIAGTATAKYRSTDRFVGVRMAVHTKSVNQPRTAEVIVVDSTGTPKNDVDVRVEYAFAHHKWGSKDYDIPLLHSCQIPAGTHDRSCTYVPQSVNSFVVMASIESKHGTRQYAVETFYTKAEKPKVVQTREHECYIDIRPDSESTRKVQYAVGETARLVIDNNCLGANALITVEAHGVLDHWVRPIRKLSQPMEVPIRQRYFPNANITGTVMYTASTGKPANLIAPPGIDHYPQVATDSYRVDVRESDLHLDFEIETDRDVYKPGDDVDVTIRSMTSEPIEFAVAVVDEGVLDLLHGGTEDFDPYEGLYDYRQSAASNFSLLNDYIEEVIVVGSRFKRASFSVENVVFDQTFQFGVNSDGGDPNHEIRLADSLLIYWNPTIQSDHNGNARFHFKAGRRLTGWRIIVVGVTPDERFGLKEASIKTNLPFEIRPAMPNQVTELDTLNAGFSILNRTDNTREVEVEIEVMQSGTRDAQHDKKTIVIKPFERRVVATKVEVGLVDSDKQFGWVGFAVRAKEGATVAELDHYLMVHPNRKINYSTIFGTTTDSTLTEPIEIPSNIREGTGEFTLQVNSSILNGLKGPFAHVRDYRYQCWEQRLSQAVVAAQYGNLHDVLDTEWTDSDSLVRAVLDDAKHFQAPSGGMGFWIGSHTFVDPYLSAYTALAFRWLRDAGYQIPDDEYSFLILYLESLIQEDEFPNYLKSNAATVPTLKAMIVNAIAKSGMRDTSLVNEVAQDISLMGTFGIAQLLDATIGDDDAGEVRNIAMRYLENRVARSGDTSLIAHDTGRFHSYMLANSLTTTCTAIAALVDLEKNGKPMMSPNHLSSLVRGVVFAKSDSNRWKSPHESAFCVNALVDYSQTMESASTNRRITAKLALEKGRRDVRLNPHSENGNNGGSYEFNTALNPRTFGQIGNLEVRKRDRNRIYYEASLRFEPKRFDQSQQNRGIHVTRSYWTKADDTWTEVDENARLNRGQLVHAVIDVQIRDPRSYVVVDDPVPGALEPVNFDLANASQEGNASYPKLHDAVSQRYGSRTQSRSRIGRWDFYHREQTHDSVRFYSDFLRPGTYRLMWVGQVVATGEFLARQTHSEAMYTPEVHGKSKAVRLKVRDPQI